MSAAESGSMRELMPEVTGFIDACREVFGATEVNGWIRAGLKDGSFWAKEGAHTVGAKPVEAVSYTTAGQWLRGCELIELDKRRRETADAKGWA